MYRLILLAPLTGPSLGRLSVVSGSVLRCALIDLRLLLIGASTVGGTYAVLCFPRTCK